MLVMAPVVAMMMVGVPMMLVVLHTVRHLGCVRGLSERHRGECGEKRGDDDGLGVEHVHDSSG